MEGLGNEGELVDVKLGYLRNYLVPQRLATAATQDILEQKREEERKREEARRQKKAEAEDLARALRTIGTFSVTKKAGEVCSFPLDLCASHIEPFHMPLVYVTNPQNNKIFGRVSAEDITAAIKEQIDQDLKKESLSLPEIRELGDFNVTATLHPEVKAQFTVRCQPAKGGRRGAE